MVLRRTMGCLCWLVASCHVASNLHAWGAPALPNHSVSALSLAAGSGSASRHSCIDTGCRPPAHRSASMCASTVGRATYTDELPVSVGGEGGHCGGAGLAKPPTQGLQCRAPPSAASGPSSGGEIARGPLTPWQSMVLGRRVGPTARWLAVLGADPSRAAGWTNKATLLSHIDSHLAGTLQGNVSDQWLRDSSRQRCPVCGLRVSTRFGTHPTCQPSVRAALGAATAPRPATEAQGLPTLDQIQGSRVRTLRHIPATARFLWGQALIRAVAATVHYNDLKAWTELLMLPQCVLGAPPRAGRRHRRAAAAYTLDRLRRWTEGERRSLWEDSHQLSLAGRKPLKEAQRRELAINLAREGFDRKACNALLQTGLCEENGDTTAALRALHPVQPTPTSDPASLPLADELPEDCVALLGYECNTSVRRGCPAWPTAPWST